MPKEVGYDPLPFPTQPTVHHGPCLYLGPSGQRCDRQAVEGGFCASHQPAGGKHSIADLSRRALGVLGVLAVVWPLLADLIREIIRLLR
jgi:hypothetical protein